MCDDVECVVKEEERERAGRRLRAVGRVTVSQIVLPRFGNGKSNGGESVAAGKSRVKAATAPTSVHNEIMLQFVPPDRCYR